LAVIAGVDFWVDEAENEGRAIEPDSTVASERVASSAFDRRRKEAVDTNLRQRLTGIYGALKAPT